MDLGKTIAFNLKKLRTERNLSLGQLATESGISKTMLSDIEKGGSNPTINTIWKIANGLNVPYTSLIDAIEDDAKIVHREEIVPQTGESKAYRVYCYYKTSSTRNFELFFCELDPNSSNKSIGHSIKAQEYIYVLEGQLVLNTENGEYILNEGDSLSFDSSVEHTYSNKENRMATFMIINYYPE